MKLILSILTIAFVFSSSAQTAKEIIEKVDDKMRGVSNKTEMKMTIVRPDWKREVIMKSWALDRDYSLILITSPVRDKGQAFLKRKNEMWNWQPTIDRVIKLPPSMMLQSWMGSDFTNDDLIRESSVVHDYKHTLKGDSIIDGKPVYRIEMIPNPDAPVVWGKIVTFIDKTDYNQHLVRYYDEDGYLVSTMVMSNIKNMGGRIIPSKMEMIPADEPDNKTVIEYVSMEFDIDISDQFFSMQNMKRIR